MPALSVIVACRDAAYLANCLASLQAQTEPVQIIVASDKAVTLPPTIHHTQQPTPTPIAHLHAAALPHATGDVIAFTEAVCTFPPGWATAVLQAHAEHPAPAIGGTISPAPDLRPSDLGLLAVTHGRFFPPQTTHSTRDLPDLNLSYKREPLLAAVGAGKVSLDDLGWQTAVLWEFEADPPARLCPEIQAVYYRRASKGAILRRQWRHGRCFGGRRAQNAPPLRRPLIALFGWLLIPALMKLQLWRVVRPRLPAQTPFWLILPHALRAILAWTAGEWWGNLFGPGRSCQHT